MTAQRAYRIAKALAALAASEAKAVVAHLDKRAGVPANPHKAEKAAPLAGTEKDGNG